MDRPDPISFEVVDPTGRAATAAMTAYFDELDARFPGGFDRTGALGPGAAAMGPPGGAFLVAVAEGGAVVGCGGVQPLGPGTVEVKRMWVDAGRRGAGLGRRLLAALEQCAGELGAHRVVLDTNSTLTEAIAMYEAAGYRPTERYNDNPYAERWFEKDLTPQRSVRAHATVENSSSVAEGDTAVSSTVTSAASIRDTTPRSLAQ